MNDQAPKLYTGHAGACAVLVGMLIDKGIVSQSEVFDRFQRAQSAAGRRTGGRAAAQALADVVEHLKLDTDDPRLAPFERSTLIGETVLVVEADFAIAHDLQGALERAGAEVLVARNAAEALARTAQFDFSVAVVEWRPDTREHRTLVRWLREDGVRFIFRAAQLPEDGITARERPILLRSAPPQEVVGALAQLASPTDAERGPA